MTYPNTYDQILFASIDKAYDMGCRAVGATIYFGSPESDRQIVEVAQAFEHAHELGMVTILWCYLRNPAFKTDKEDYHNAADLTGQANHLGVTIEADIIKQKAPTCNGGFKTLKFGKQTEKCIRNSLLIILLISPVIKSSIITWGAWGLSIPGEHQGRMTLQQPLKQPW